MKTDVEAGRIGFCVEAEGGCHPAVKGHRGRRAARLHRELPRIQRSRSRRRSAAAARRTAPRSSPHSRRRCATAWTSSTSPAAARRPIRARTSSSRRSRTSCARASSLSSRPGTTATSSASGRRDRPRPRPTRSASGPSRTPTSSARRCRSSRRAGSRAVPFAPADSIAAVVDLGEPAARRRRAPIAGVSRQLCDAAPGRLAARRDRARQPRRLPVQCEGRARERRGRDRDRHRREPPGRSDVRALLRRPGRHDLRSRRRADPCGGGRAPAVRSPFASRATSLEVPDDVGGRSDELLRRQG